MPSSGETPWSLGPGSEWETYWEYARSHRNTVAQLIVESVPRGGSVCCWGAGSCHDLNLRQLIEHCSEVTLVDIREQNLRLGVEFQLGSAPDNLRFLAPLDLAGIPAAAEPEALASHESILNAIVSHRVPQIGTHDLIVSTGMLSQIILDGVAAHGISPDATSVDDSPPARETHDPALLSSLVAIRRRHLALMLEHLKPSGRGLVVVDVINSDDVPQLTTTTNDLEATVHEALAANRYSHVLAKRHLHNDLLLHPPLARRVENVDTTNYWIWRMTRRRYACYAVRFAARRPDSRE